MVHYIYNYIKKRITNMKLISLLLKWLGFDLVFEKYIKNTSRAIFTVICKSATYTTYNVFEGSRLYIYIRNGKFYCKEEKEFNKQFTKLPIKLP